MTDIDRKLKSLALILRSLPPKSQKLIFEQLPLPLVKTINDIDLTIDEQLSQDDWDYFMRSWPEFAQLLETVNQESKIQKSFALMKTERDKIRTYLEYKVGKRSDRPNLTRFITRVVDEFAVERN